MIIKKQKAQNILMVYIVHKANVNLQIKDKEMKWCDSVPRAWLCLQNEHPLDPTNLCCPQSIFSAQSIFTE